MSATITVITASDRASEGEYEDRSGPAIADFLREQLVDDYTLATHIVPDERETLAALLTELCDGSSKSDWVLMTGGTGPAPRDVTPEALSDVAERHLPGFGERMRSVAWDRVPTAILSRQGAAIRGSTLIISLPGSPKAIRECLGVVLPAVPHCLELIGAKTVGLQDGSGRVSH